MFKKIHQYYWTRPTIYELNKSYGTLHLSYNISSEVKDCLVYKETFSDLPNEKMEQQQGPV